MPLADLVGADVGVQFRRTRAFALALAVEGPAVVHALEPLLDDLAAAQTHAAMRTDVIERRRLAVVSAKEHDVLAAEFDADRFLLKLLTDQHRLPVIEDTHDVNPQVCMRR